MVHLEYFTFKLQLQCSLPIAAIDVLRELWWVCERKQIDKLNAMVIEKEKKTLGIYSRPGAGILHNPVILFTSVRVCACSFA